MKTLHTYSTADKSTWGEGPWQSEPDKIQGIDEETGLDVLIVRNHWGALCGYVGVPESHPYFGVSYGGCTQKPPCAHDGPYCDHAPDVSVHGGLTFTDFCQEGAEEHGICHLPADGRPDRVWWLGFDCAHHNDLSPKHAGEEPKLFNHGTYRTVAYVEAECLDLARQLAAVHG